MDESWRPVLRLFRLPPMDPAMAQAIIAILLLVVLGLVVASAGLTIRSRRRVRQWRWQVFYQMAETKDLSEDETELLRALRRRAKVQDPTLLLRSLYTFDEVVNRHLAGLPPDSEERAWLVEELADIRQKLLFDRNPEGSPLRSTRALQRGQRIRLEVEQSGWQRYFRSSVVAVDDGELLIALPADAMGHPAFQAGGMLTVHLWNPGDAGYRFTTPVQRVVPGSPMCLGLAHSHDLQRIQRRQFFRISAAVPTVFHILSRDQAATFSETGNLDLPPHEHLEHGNIVNLSGGGALLLCSRPVAAEDLVWLELHIAKDTVVSDVIARVVRARKVSVQHYRNTLEFINLTEKAREIVVRYVTYLQRTRART